MIRRAFRFISLISFLLFIAIGGLWLRSESTSDEIQIATPASGKTKMASVRSFVSTNGQIITHISHKPAEPSANFELRWNSAESKDGGKLPAGAAYISDWLITVVFAILPAMLIRAAMIDRRIARSNICRKCRYDLRATADRCPECGTVPSWRQRRDIEKLSTSGQLG